jgi:pyruvate dehydrogenase E2 component (dihydrolipoamide acetyltransferase)
MASPVAKRLAVELGVDLASLTGTGPNGIISRDDVLKASEESGVQKTQSEGLPSVDKEISPIGIKKLVAIRMKESYLDAPHIHLTTSCVMSDASRLRMDLNNKADHSKHVTVTDLILLATGLTLTKHSLLNATFREEKIVTFSDVNVGFAVASEKGLVVPVIRRIDRLSLINVAETRHALAERVQMGSQTLDDLNGGTFTVTNLGMFGIEAFDPIITPGQSGILAVGKIKNSIVISDDGEMRIAPTMTITLACDHRVADGVDGAKFLADLVALLENPESLFAGLL